MSEKGDRQRSNDMLVTLLMLGRFSLLPELLDFFHGDAQMLLRFIDQFGGMRLDIPSKDVIARMARDVHIWQTLSNGIGLKSKKVLDLAALYGVNKMRILQIERETRKEIERFDKITRG